ncbi:hypothetical protein ABKN59_010260 [Abortiporus biennis]
MSAKVTNTTLPNPLTPLAFLPPDIAHQVQVAQLLVMAVIGAWMWDYLMFLYEEYSMFIKHKLALPDVVYALSRIVAISYIAMLIIYAGGPIAHNNCNEVDKAAAWTGVITITGRLTKALIQSGQLYYLATVGVNLIAMVANLAPWVPEVYRAILTTPDRTIVAWLI